VRAGGKTFREEGLRCFQEAAGERRDVPCHYALDLDDLEITIALGSYDRAKPLVIDPEIAWSSYLGGSADDTAYAVAVDASGNVYVTGRAGAGFPTTGGFDNTFGGGDDAFVTKVNAGGTSLAWSSYLGGSDEDAGTGIAVDSADDVYIEGLTASSDFPTVGGFDTAYGLGAYDVFVTKVDAAGSGLVWSSYLGGSSADYGNGIAVDSGGNVFVAGMTWSSDFPTIGGFDTTYGSTGDAFVAEVDAAGSSLVWSSYLGEAGTDDAYGIAVSSPSVLVAGTTDSSDFPTVGGFGTTYGGSGDGFVTAVDANGTSVVWSSYLGGSDYDAAATIKAAWGGVYVAGVTRSSDFPTTGGFDSTWGGGGSSDAFVAKVDPGGSSLDWSSYLGGSGEDFVGSGIGVDAWGNVEVAGGTGSPDFPTTDGFDTTWGGGGFFDAFVSKVYDLGSGCVLAWSSYLGGSAGDTASGFTEDSFGIGYVVGATASSDFPTMGGFDTALAGSGDGFVTKIGCGVALCGDGCCDFPLENE
jgi:beta-propeller repeat-containing protein